MFVSMDADRGTGTALKPICDVAAKLASSKANDGDNALLDASIVVFPSELGCGARDNQWELTTSARHKALAKVT